MRMVRQLGREDWILAGLQTVARAGDKALSVEAVARELGVTKGSFYWHFRDRDAWRDALLQFWEHRAFAALVGMRGACRLSFGSGSAGRNAPGDVAWAALERALRDWARREVAVAQSWSRVQQERARAEAAACRAA